MAEQTATEEGADHWAAALLEVWARRRWLAVVALVIPLAASLAVASFLPNLYRSSALVEVQHQPANLPDANGADGETQLERLNEENLSRARLQLLIGRFDLYPQIRRKGAMEAAIAQMRRDTQIEVKDQDHSATVAFTVGFRGANPEKVSQVANALASFYVEKSAEQGKALAQGEVAALQSQVAQAKTRLDAEEKQVNDFIAAHLQELPEQERVNLATLDRLNAQLAALNHRTRISPDTHEAVAAPMIEDPSSTEMDKLLEQLNVLRGQVTDQHPDVRHLKAEIAALAATQAHHPRQPISTNLSMTASSAASEELQPVQPPRSREEAQRQLRSAIASTEQKVYNSPMREQELQALLAPLAITRQLYGTLSEKLDEAQRLEKERELDPFRILDPAVPAREPAGPDRLKIAAAGVVMSILLAMLAMFVAEKLDTSFHSLDELRAFTRVPVLASVPNIVVARDSARQRTRARLALVLVVLAVATGIAASYAFAHNNESLVWMLAHGRA